jgi:hypothetical protein
MGPDAKHGRKERLKQAVTDYIAGMTTAYAVKLFRYQFTERLEKYYGPILTTFGCRSLTRRTTSSDVISHHTDAYERGGRYGDCVGFTMKDPSFL